MELQLVIRGRYRAVANGILSRHLGNNFLRIFTSNTKFVVFLFALSSSLDVEMSYVVCRLLLLLQASITSPVERNSIPFLSGFCQPQSSSTHCRHHHHHYHCAQYHHQECDWGGPSHHILLPMWVFCLNIVICIISLCWVWDCMCVCVCVFLGCLSREFV